MKHQLEEIELQRLENIQTNKTPAQLYFQQRIKAPYKKHNAYTNDKSFPQIATIIFFILQIIFHSVYVAPFVYEINNEILNFFFILNYFVMCAVIGHYIYLTTNDPVDSLIVDLNQKETVQKNSKQQTVFCIMCQKTVKKTSKHCYDCGRCTEEYDHHCSCLNNCIGLGNYQQFIRMLFFYQIFNGLTTIQAIWMIVQKDNENHGGEIFLIILCLIAFGLILLVLIFHCYLNCYVKKPTYQFFKDQKNRKYEIYDKVETRNLYGEVLAMVLRQKRNNAQKNKQNRQLGSKQNIV